MYSQDNININKIKFYNKEIHYPIFIKWCKERNIPEIEIIADIGFVYENIYMVFLHLTKNIAFKGDAISNINSTKEERHKAIIETDNYIYDYLKNKGIKQIYITTNNNGIIEKALENNYKIVSNDIVLMNKYIY